MKVLYLFANEFPYGTWEPYLETEVHYYAGFDKVYVFSLQLRKEHAQTRRPLPPNFTVIPIYYAPKWVYLLNSFRVLGDAAFYHEIKRLQAAKRLNAHRIVDLFVYLSRSHYEAALIQRNIEKDELNNALFYSYRFEYQPYVAMLIRKKNKVNVPIVCRAHRYDLYENFRPHGYIPLREELLQNIHSIFPCSDDGAVYLRKRFLSCTEKIVPRFLGTVDHATHIYTQSDEFHLVSCSNVVVVKRLHLIVDALSCITDVPIRWTHFGDGVLMEKIRKYAEKRLPDNVTTDFRGNVKNRDLLKCYKKENFFLFLNVSESEGIPVSIMEAMSFGIPCIATDVGGTKEILFDKQAGVLLDVSCTSADIADAIRTFIGLTDTEYQSHRNHARSSWEQKFRAENNYKIFVDELLQLLD